MNGQRANHFTDACSRTHYKPNPLRLVASPQSHAETVAPLDQSAARLQRVTFPKPATPGKTLNFWSLTYRDKFVGRAALVLGVSGAAVVTAGKALGVL